MSLRLLNDSEILALRPNVERPESSNEPIAIMREREAEGAGSVRIADVFTILLRGAECTFRCLMCDLWKSTHATPTPRGAIAAQVAYSVALQGSNQWIKLYNASNFFAPRSVPTGDLPAIADSVRDFERVIVENHPRLLCPEIEHFKASIAGKLEIAMGLETIHPAILPALNKHMTLSDFSRACDWLLEREIDVRVFVLLRPPGLSEQAGIEWCVRSIEFACARGARHVSVIPLRGGNGAIEHLQNLGQFQPPRASSLEAVMDATVAGSTAVVTADLWDWHRLRGLCPKCSQVRQRRLEEVNLTQRPAARLTCHCDERPEAVMLPSPS